MNNIDNDVMMFFQKILGDICILNEMIQKKGLHNNLKLQISVEMTNGNITKTLQNIQSKERKRLNGQNISKLEKSKYKSDVEQMLLDGITIEEIATFLKKQNENISRSSIGRYAQKFFKDKNISIIKSEVSHND